jgi:hypothetical protein
LFALRKTRRNGVKQSANVEAVAYALLSIFVLAAGASTAQENGTGGQPIQTAPAPQAKTQPSASSDKESDKQSSISKQDGEAKETYEGEGKKLEGHIKGTALPTDEGLARIGIATGYIQDTCERIMREATRKDTIVVRGPNVVGTTVIPALGGAGGVMQFGEMPIRRNRLDQWVSQNEQNITALQSYVDALIIPEDKLPEVIDIFNSLRRSMQDAQDHLSILKELSAAKRLSNGKIGRQAVYIFDAMTAISKDRSQMNSILKAPAPPPEP